MGKRSIQLVCLQNDDVVLKQLENELAENGHVVAQTGEPSPTYHNTVIHTCRQGQYNSSQESWFIGNGGRTLPGCEGQSFTLLSPFQ